MAKAVDTERASPVGARASNAGDQYQELWALQQALGLLVPSTGLTAVTVEGIASEGVDEDQRVWDGVDCALYFGGKNLETANTVVIAQHKYSTTAPEKDWTIARLVRNTKKKEGDNSVLRRLADAFGEAKRRMQPNTELQIRLVTNQGISPEVFEALDALKADGTTTPNNAVSENIDKLRSSTGLNDGDLRSFAKSLDLSDCGQSSRRSIRSEITKHVAEILGEDVSNTVRELMSFMRELMMPEKDRVHITRETVLGWFDVAADTGLFPAPSDFKIVANPIDREPARALLAALVGGSKLTCLHGSAGCGKTTSLLQLRSLLPPSSVFALFDCYGGGRYLFSTDRRHLPEHAFTQIANELSLDLGIPFLLARGSNSPILVRRFLERVSLAAELLKKSEPNALLVVGIDAADNSVTAAKRSTPPEACFVTELARADMTLLPSNVRLVFSARTVRKDSLELPSDAKSIPCPAFSPQETEAFAKRTIPTVTAEWIEQFHALSNGIPRVQDYAFQAGDNEPTATLNALRPGGKNLADVLRKLFQEALKKAGISTSYDILMSSLAALPAPIPIEHFAKIANRWGLHHSDKGSMPIIERLGYYLEWNAVLCVVGEMLQKYPLWQPEGEYWGTFGYWAQKLQLTVPPVWAADLRDPKPLEDQLWLPGAGDDDRWVSRISQQEFVSALFNENGTDRSVVTVEGSWTSGFPTREVHAKLSSALVNPATAGALSRSLSMRERRQWAYHLPDADSDHEYDERFKEMPYKLVGWLTEVRNEEGIDLKDTLRNGTKGPTKSPGQSVLTELGLVADIRPAKTWKKSDSGKVVVHETVWADLPERYDDDRSYRQRETKSEGNRLQIDADVLMSFLKKQQMSLIVGVHLERRLEEEYGGRYDDKTKKRKAFEQFFIFRTDGTIENHKGAIGTWWKAR